MSIINDVFSTKDTEICRLTTALDFASITQIDEFNLYDTPLKTRYVVTTQIDGQVLSSEFATFGEASMMYRFRVKGIIKRDNILYDLIP